MPRQLIRAQVSVNIGPNAPIETVSSALNDLSVVCQFGGRLQQQTSRMKAARAVLRNPERWIESAEAFERYLPILPSLGLRYTPYLLPYGYLGIEQAIDRYMQERDLDDGDVTVESVSYHNPLELIISVGTVGFLVLGVIREVRDWPARRRMNNATASEYEDIARARKAIRSVLVQRMVSGEQPVSPELIDSLLTDGVAESIRALANADTRIQELEQAPGGEDRQGDEGHQDQP